MALRDKINDAVSKGKAAAAKNSDKITGAVDKTGGFIDRKTKGRYSDKIAKGAAAAKKAIPPQA